MVSPPPPASMDFLNSSVGKESACNAGEPSSISGSGRSSREGIGYPLPYSWASLVAQLVKNPLQCRRPGFDPWVGKIPWRRESLLTPGLENSMDCIAHGVTKSRTPLSDLHVHSFTGFHPTDQSKPLQACWKGAP